MKAEAELFRKLPSVDELVRDSLVAGLVAEHGHAAVADACRAVLARLRREISTARLDEKKLALALDGVADAVASEVRHSLSYSLKPVINATGVILHTNLGRAPLAESALEHIREVASSYSNLELDLESGERGKRDVHVDRLFQKLLNDGGRTSSGAASFHAGTATIVVNNNAAAVLLALNTLGDGGEVIVSRGELVEIGGSFRIPDVMVKSGAMLREVGTTNRSRAADYERAINERTKLLLRVHRSNFEITGFTEQPDLGELVAVSQKHKIPLMEDLGSGALFDLRSLGINNEPGVLESLRLGVDVVTYSGDKLLGGPQAGLISGRQELVTRMRANSLFRALRVDKLTYAALEATILGYVRRDYDTIPALRMMGIGKGEIRKRVEQLVSQLKTDKLRCEITTGESLIGGGSAPSAALPTALIAITHQKLSADELATRLRASHPPIMARVDQGRLLLDLRTVFPEEEPLVLHAISNL